MNTLAATAYIQSLHIIEVPNKDDLATLTRLLELLMVLFSFLILTWRELQPALVFLLAAIDVAVVWWKVGSVWGSAWKYGISGL